jgi:hypothetical protein
VPKIFQNRHSNPLNFGKKVFYAHCQHLKNTPKIHSKFKANLPHFHKKNQNLTFLHGGFALNKKPALLMHKTLLATSAKKIHLKRRTKSP